MRFARTISLLLAALVGAACADGMDDVNRVQPNYYDKSLFTGTWYMRQTIVEAPYEAFFAIEGFTNSMAKIRWEIQEKYLIAYSVSDPVPGANDPASGAPSYQPVAAWPIISHFDIIREYNPATGEQSNVIVENSYDRPWYERQYIRVDWGSSKTMSDFVFDHEFTRLRMSGANHWIQPHEETDPDAAEITENYISVVNAFDARIPYGWCWALFGDNSGIGWYDNGITEPCGPATVRVRTSFAKVDPKREQAYEPLNYLDQRRLLAPVDINGDGKIDEDDTIDYVLEICSDVRRNESGGLYCSKYSYVPCTDAVIEKLAADPFYARNFNYTKEDCVETQMDYMNRFPYFRTSKIGYDRERGQVDFTRQSLINRHHIWERSLDEHGNPIPYNKRTPKPIVYYLNAEFPPDMYDAAFEIGRQWDEAFRQTVALLQDKSIDEVPTMFEVRLNSCSPENLEKYVAKNPQAKKIAKRVIGGMDNLRMDNIKNLCAALEHDLGFHWQKMGDVRYNFLFWVNKPTLGGLLGYGPSSADPDTGEIVSASAYVYGAAVDRQAAFATDLVLLLTGRLDEVQILRGEQILESVRRGQRLKAEARNARPSDSFFREFDRRMSVFRKMPWDKATRTMSLDEFHQRLERLKEYGVDKRLFPSELASLLPPQIDPNMDYEEAIANAREGSFFDLISPKKIEERRQIEMLKGKHYCMLEEDMIDSEIIGFALEFDATQGGRELSREEIFQIIRKKIFIGVALHEVGHTLGLRHNFAGSRDSLNYFDELWEYLQLPEDPATAMAEATEEVAQRLQHCIDRAQKRKIPVPTTLECLRATELKQASIMDYGGKFNSDFHGLGKYDKAAIAFGYGGLIEVFENREAIEQMEYEPSVTAFATKYTNIPDAFGGVENLLARKWINFEEYQKQLAYDAIVRQDALPRIEITEDFAGCTQNCDTTAEYEVPYESCIDEWESSSMNCYRWDTGASQEEMIDAIINEYESYYPLYAFRRGRANWGPFSYIYRLQRDFLRGTRVFQYYYYYNHVWRESNLVELDIVKDFQAASAKALNLLARVMQTPASGRHCLAKEGDRYIFVDTYSDQQEQCALDERGFPEMMFDVPIGVGRPHWWEYTPTRPHYAIETLGTYFERVQALLALTWMSSPFKQETGDPRTFVIGFNKAFEPEITKLIGSIGVGDLKAFSPGLDMSTGEPIYRPLVDLERFGLPVGGEEPTEIIAAPHSFDDSDMALFFGMIFLTSSEDAVSEFRNYFNVVLKGSDEDFETPNWVDVGDENEYIEYTNPYSGLVYRSFVHPVSPENSFGHRALLDAKRFTENVWEPARAEAEAKRKDWETAEANGAPDAAEKYQEYMEADAAFQKASFELNEKLELIDRIRFWYRVTKLGR